MTKVPVQKGPINPDMKTQKTMTRKEVIEERVSQNEMRNSGQTLTPLFCKPFPKK